MNLNTALTTCLLALMLTSGLAAAKEQIIYEQDYPQGRLVISVSQGAARSEADLKSWLTKHANRPSSGRRVISKKHKVKAGAEGVDAFVLRVISGNAPGKTYSFLAVCGARDNFTIIDASGPEELFQKTAQGSLRHVSEVLKQRCAAAPAQAAVEPQPTQTKIKDFQEYWYVAKVSFGANGAYAVRKGVVTFDDGAVTDDINGWRKVGRAASQQENPRDWGRYKIENGDFLIRWRQENNFTEYSISEKVKPAKTLRGCYESTDFSTIGSLDYNTAVKINEWCFSENGRFANDKSLSLNLNSGGVGASGYGSKALKGSYHLEGRSITFEYDNGRRHSTLVGFVANSKGVLDLLLGGVYYEAQTP